MSVTKEQKIKRVKEVVATPPAQIKKETKIRGYLRVSTDEQSMLRQKDLINSYCQRNQWDTRKLKFFEITISSRKSVDERKVLSFIADLGPGDILLVAELSRLGRSTAENLSLIDQIVNRGIVLIIVDLNLTLDINNKKDLISKVVITMFSMLSEIERDIISNRTRDSLQALKNSGKKLGKEFGTKQKTIYDDSRELITKLLKKKFKQGQIIEQLGFGTRQSLANFIKSREIYKDVAKLPDDLKLEISPEGGTL